MSASKIKKTEPAADVEFVQLLQDMIGDLTSQPEPIVIKLFSQDGTTAANDTAPRVADAIGKIHGVVDVLNGIENTVSGPAVTFQVNPAVAARAGFTAEEVSYSMPPPCSKANRLPRPSFSTIAHITIRVRFPDRNPLFARQYEQHPARQFDWPHRDARFARDHSPPTQVRPRFGAKICSDWWKSRRAWKASASAQAFPRCKKPSRSTSAFVHPRRVWRAVSKSNRQSFRDALFMVLLLALRFCLPCCCSSSALSLRRRPSSLRRCSRPSADFWPCSSHTRPSTSLPAWA